MVSPLNSVIVKCVTFPVHTQVQSEVSSSSHARQKLEGLLNKNMRIRMTDGRTLVGLFLCTDRDCNVILGSAQEFLKSTGQWGRKKMSSIMPIINLSVWNQTIITGQLKWKTQNIQDNKLVLCPEHLFICSCDNCSNTGGNIKTGPLSKRVW